MARVYSAGQPLPAALHSGTLIPGPGGRLSLLCHTEGHFQLLKHSEVVHLGRCAEHRLTTATPSRVCLNSIVQSHNFIVLIGLGLTDPPASASRALGLTVCSTMPSSVAGLKPGFSAHLLFVF